MTGGEEVAKSDFGGLHGIVVVFPSMIPCFSLSQRV